MPHRRWIMPRPETVDTAGGIAPLVARILAARRIGSTDQPAFLSPEPPAFLRGGGTEMTDLEKAATRVRRALRDGERIVVYGDYDVDGIAGSAILVRVLRALGASVSAYIPNRYEEGYGLNADAMKRLAADGARVVVSVDCGVTAVREAALARELGVDLIVTDHHHPPPVLPDAFALVNPRRPGDPSPDKDLSGAAVALALGRALLDDDGYAAQEAALLQLAALATIADVVPLRGANRWLTRAGLAALNRAPSAGVRALAERAGLRVGRVGAADVGYVLGPRLNAAGRLADAEQALRLLLTEDVEEAKALADALEERNLERQARTREVVAGARAQAAASPDAWVTVVADAAWPAGVVGLAASRLVEDYGRPAAVIAIDGTEGRGSCRSIADVHIAEALAECDDLLLKHGGHAMAAGFSVRSERIADLVGRLDAIVRERLQGVRPVPTLAVDAAIEPGALTSRLAVELAELEPCGAGNPRPRLLLRDVRVFGVRQVGADLDHLRCKLTVGRFTFDAMAFRRGDGAEALGAEGRVDAVVTIGTGLRGMVELEVQDFGAVGTAAAMEARVPAA